MKSKNPTQINTHSPKRAEKRALQDAQDAHRRAKSAGYIQLNTLDAATINIGTISAARISAKSVPLAFIRPENPQKKEN